MQKMKALLIAWAAITAAILWWPTHQVGFKARWVQLPPAMSWATFEAARKRNERIDELRYANQRLGLQNEVLVAMIAAPPPVEAAMLTPK